MDQATTTTLLSKYLSALNDANRERMMACVTDDVIHDVNQGGERRVGRDRFEAYTARMQHHYSETLSDIVLLVSEDGRRAAAEYNLSGTYVNTEDGLPPANNQTYQLPAAIFFAIEGGRIERITTYYNLTDWLTQITSQPAFPLQ